MNSNEDEHSATQSTLHRVCAVCGDTIEGSRRAQCCSARCRARRSRTKQAERVRRHLRRLKDVIVDLEEELPD